MSTTEITPTVAVPLTTENIEYRVYAQLDNQGNIVKDEKGNPIRELKTPTQKDPDFSKYEKDSVDAEKGTHMETELVQTVSKPKFGSLDAFIKYFEDDSDLMMYIINLGTSARFNAVVPKELLDTNEDGSLAFPATEVVFDPRELMCKEVQRRNLSPVEKATRDLKKLTSGGVSPAELIAMLQALQASQS